ncbi:MAG: DNA-binding protein [Oceanospirillaceae bacterium]|nr:DNA-binding protein [Oceanospirillaceae bacterium]
MNKELVYASAESILMRGEQPTIESVMQSTGLDENDVQIALHSWWRSIPEKLSFSNDAISVPGLPESLGNSFGRIWRQAIEEAEINIRADSRTLNHANEEVRKLSEETLKESHNKRSELESRVRELKNRLEDVQIHNRSLEAELSVVKTAIGTEATSRKKEEHLRIKLENDLVHLRKAHEDAKRTFEQRLKEDQRHALDQISKSEADARYYRTASEKLRDDASMKETNLTKKNHDLQSEIARHEVRIDTQHTLIRSQEEELKELKHSNMSQSREMVSNSSALLSENNKAKRLEQKRKELDAEIKRLNQKGLNSSTEWGRRENMMRNELRSVAEELQRAQLKVANLEKRCISQDEEIRRIKSKL